MIEIFKNFGTAAISTEALGTANTDAKSRKRKMNMKMLFNFVEKEYLRVLEIVNNESNIIFLENEIADWKLLTFSLKSD